MSTPFLKKQEIFKCLIFGLFTPFFSVFSKSAKKFFIFFSFLFPFTALLFAPYTLILCRQFLKVSCPFPFQAIFSG